MFIIMNKQPSFVYDYKHKGGTEMLYLSDDAIRYAVAKCSHTDNYKAVVALKYMRQKDDVERVVMECIVDNTRCHIRRHYYGFVVTFDNGSVFRTIPASENARGYRYHLLVADERIDDEIMNCVLRPKEILEDLDRHYRQREQEQETNTGQPDFYAELECMFNEIHQDCNAVKDIDYPEVSEAEFLKLLNTY